MRKFIIFVLCFMLFCIIIVCSQNDGIDGVIFQKVDSSSLNDSSLSETLNDNLEDGIYELRTDKKCYIIFNGIENSYKDVSYKTNGSSLEILFRKEQLLEKDQIVYELVLPADIDTIKLLQDGEEIAFKASIYKN